MPVAKRLNVIGLENFGKILKKKEVRLIIKDLKMHGAYAIQIVYSRDRKSITNMYHLPVKSIA